MQRPALLVAALAGALNTTPDLGISAQGAAAGTGGTAVMPLEHRHQHARPDLGECIGVGAPLADPLMQALGWSHPA